jgi:hypothetical protein
MNVSPAPTNEECDASSLWTRVVPLLVVPTTKTAAGPDDETGPSLLNFSLENRI